MGKVYNMKISGSGVADNGRTELKRLGKLIEGIPDKDDVLGAKRRFELVDMLEEFKQCETGMAEIAISCLHDALLAVAKGMLTPEQVKDFFWESDLADAKFFGDILKFTEREESAENTADSDQNLPNGKSEAQNAS